MLIPQTGVFQFDFDKRFCALIEDIGALALNRNNAISEYDSFCQWYGSRRNKAA